MGRQFVTACMFCLLCSTHTHCASHHENSGADRFGNSGQISFHRDEGGGGKFNFDDFKSSDDFAVTAKRAVRDVSTAKDDVDYVKVIFEKYGNGDTLSKAGFSKLLNTLGLIIEGHTDGDKKNSSNSTSKCAPLLSRVPDSGLQKKDYQELCPQILLRLTPESHSMCDEAHSSEHDHNHSHHNDEVVSSSATWFYATLSVLLISLCGLLAVAVIPVMQKQIYHGLLQFLVALAVGTLVGDALLHLLPHAMMSSHSDHAHSSGHSSNSDEDLHRTNLWKGFVAAMSAVFFYFTEKGLSLATDWKKRHQRKNKAMTKVRVMIEDRSSHEEARVGEKLCKHKYSSYPYCYGEIADNTEHQPNGGEGENKNNVNFKESSNSKPQEGETEPKEELPNAEKQLLDSSEAQNEYTTIILREHENVHHGHSHTHGHVHSAPGSIKSVAWMVIMGDGIHNLTDGLAIGAAFAANIGGGLSTAVAVFCHELPHEIGDFAVLLKAGMSIKQAVVYNLISSILCLVGMSMGVLLGQNDHVKLWVFSAAAGMFLYIALVDMIPELTSNHSSDGSSACCQCLVQLLGLLSGIGIMLVIALYEHDLMSAFNNSL